jgi:hypothetical protein
LFSDLLEEAQPPELGHDDIGDDGIEMLRVLAHLVERVEAVVRWHTLVPRFRELLYDGSQDKGIIFCD